MTNFKKQYLTFFSCITFAFSCLILNAQQVSIMQPAIINSNQKLDSVYLSYTIIIKSNTNLEGLTEKWIAKTYDNEKNPTKFMVYHYQDPYSNIVIDSMRVLLEHYPVNEYKTDFRSWLEGKYRGFEYPNSKIYNLFNLKSVTEELYNTNTNEWIPLSFQESLNDMRLPDANNVSFTEFEYTSNFNVISATKTEGIVENQGYLSEQTVFWWNGGTIFTPYYKFVYENTYQPDGNLQVVIKKRINNLITGVEKNISKYNFSYGSNFFEYTIQDWNIAFNGWNIPLDKIRIDYVNSNPLFKKLYKWIDGNWVDQTSITDDVYAFDNDLFAGSSYVIPTIGGGNHQFVYNLEDVLINEYSNSYSDFGFGFDSGGAEIKEFYYSSDEGITVNDFTTDSISIYPNPAINKILFNLPEEVTYKIYSIQGSVLQKGTAYNEIDVQNLKSGVYLIHFKTSKLLFYKKLIIK